MAFLLTKKKGFAVHAAHRIPRFGAQPFGCSVRSARGTRLALLPPSFLSSSPATVRSARTGAVKEASAGLVRPAAQRGHGPARLDGTRARATVADKVMRSGETAGHGNGLPTRRPHGKRSAQARSWKPGRRRQPSGARERWKPVRGETPQGVRCAARQRDRPSPRWPGTPELQRRRSNRIRTSTRKSSWAWCGCCLADPAQPGRRRSGAPSLRGGDSPQGFPLEASEARSAAGAETGTGRSKKKGAPPPKERRTESSAARSARRCRRHRLQLLDHARLDKDASLLVRDRHVEHLREHRAP